ncbi:FliH/SctL family protein [Nocardioides sp. AE5]|uniref:FliH/SctL family protein n=1 Tax=Nocardioides sp. AE5 TaxID=2962573 RepID=UPI0028813EFC|nr:FliH/SctL family protein [Nocardioides sp. AE5]MDT0200801.1 FliH/SctL family protein [Nocardioides sp. AE5]
MTSSSEARVGAPVLRGESATAVTVLPAPDLRQGTWTRLGTGAAVGDPVTERTLDALAATTRDAARAQGYAVGWAEGRRRAEEQARTEAAEVARQHAADRARQASEHEAAVAALHAAAAQLHEQAALVTARIEEQGTELAWALTRELVGAELRIAPASDVVRRVLAVLPDEPMVRVRLHPGEAAALPARDLADRGVAVDADATLAPGDAVVECADRVIDLRISAAMERVAAALEQAPHGGIR